MTASWYERYVHPLLVRSYDRALGHLLAPFLRRPAEGAPKPEWVPPSPDEIEWPATLEVEWLEGDESERHFRAPSPAPSVWPESRIVHGLSIGAADSHAAVILLHGACDNEYSACRRMARSFAGRGYQALIPAAPCHMQRRVHRTPSGAAFFWSAELVVAGLAQWLCEVRGLMGWLRARGAETIGVVGYSLGSLTAGLAATLWSDLAFVGLLAPVGHHLQAVPTSRVAAAMWPWMKRISLTEVALLDRWAALKRRPIVERIVFYITLFDDLQPTQLQFAWWNAWDRPPHHEYPHGHMSVLLCKQFYRDLERLAADVLSAPADAPLSPSTAGTSPCPPSP